MVSVSQISEERLLYSSDIFEPRLKFSKFKCISWLITLRFLIGEDRGFLEEGVQIYPIARVSPLNLRWWISSTTGFSVPASVCDAGTYTWGHSYTLRYLGFLFKYECSCAKAASGGSTPPANTYFLLSNLISTFPIVSGFLFLACCDVWVSGCK